jgi:hypothetical protein
MATERAPQITDQVDVAVTLPPETEEWLGDVLEPVHDMYGVVLSRQSGRPVLTTRMGGNTTGLRRLASFLLELDDALREGQIEPMEFEVSVKAVPGA